MILFKFLYINYNGFIYVQNARGENHAFKGMDEACFEQLEIRVSEIVRTNHVLQGVVEQFQRIS